MFKPCLDRQAHQDRLDLRETQERQEPTDHQEPPVLRDRLGVDLEAEHLNDLRRVNTILSIQRQAAFATMTEREVPDEVLTTMTTTP